MKTIALLFWFWVPWQHGPTFGYFELEAETFNECLEIRADLIDFVQARYPEGSVADGVCYSKGDR